MNSTLSYHRTVRQSRVAAAVISIGAVLSLTALLGGCTKPQAPASSTDSSATKPVAQSATSKVDRGKYLVTIIGCNDCHTPFKMGPQGPEPDMTRMLSGHPSDIKITKMPKIEEGWMSLGSMTNTAWATPLGVAFTMNLTPDSATGIGAWSQDIFMKAIRTGKHMGTSRDIMPPMPWQDFKEMTDDDLSSIYAYLQTIPKIHNEVPPPILAPMPAGAPKK